MPLKPSYLLLTGAGAIVAVAGVKGWGLSNTFRDVISGKNPSANPQLTAQISGQGAAGSFGGSAGGPVSSNLIAGLAQANPLPYQWGGKPAYGSADCSSWVNWIVGHLGGLSIPGFPNGSYDGTQHGPNTVLWLAWNGAYRVPASQAQAGDIIVWPTHMGIVVDNRGDVISDLNPIDGVRTTPIKGLIPGETPIIERLKVTAGARSGAGGKGKR